MRVRVRLVLLMALLSDVVKTLHSGVYATLCMVRIGVHWGECLMGCISGDDAQILGNCAVPVAIGMHLHPASASY